MPTVNAPFFNGKGGSSSNDAQKVESGNGATDLEPLKRASAPVLNMGPAARGVCVAAGDDQIIHPGGATKILRVPHDYFAPDGVDLIYRGGDRL